MTTDITELAHSLKRRAASANEFGESLYVKADDVLALVEELEKAQRYTEELREWNAGLAQESFERQQRIAELESRTVKLPDFRHEHFNSNWGEHDAEAYQVAPREALTADGIKWEAE